MNATERLYYQDSHLLKFTAHVINVTNDEQGRTGVILDRTAFYPTGGGQPSDTGRLGTAHVIECIDEETGSVLHVIDGPVPEIGAEVEGQVDWSRRLDHIQQHTGQHILSQSLIELFGAETRAFRMMEQASEIDVDLTGPTQERIEQAVDLANRIIWENRPVNIHQVRAEQTVRMPLRKSSTRDGELRVIEIEGFDMSPCGGTHARRTGEVGIVAVRSWERAKGLTRIVFVAGNRALNDYRRANRAARDVAAMFSVGRDEVSFSVSRLFEEHKELLRHLRSLEEIAARAEAKELILNPTEKLPDGTLIISHVFDDRDAETLKRLAQAITSQTKSVTLFGSRDGDDARLVFARSEDICGDMGALMRESCALVDGRGGGRPNIAQGGGRKTESLDEAIKLAACRLRSEQQG